MSFEYTETCRQHYEEYFGQLGRKIIWSKGPVGKLHPYFYVIEFAPSEAHETWRYCTVGMSLDQPKYAAIELFVLSPYQDESIAELLVACASFHRNDAILDLNHTVNIGRPWLSDSICDHAFVSLPYLHGEALELLYLGDDLTHYYWLIPITEAERDFKINHGTEALEQLFEDEGLDYLNPMRNSLVM
ncbi:hypothetical protein CDA63_15575 [Hymenobacter amundsenii]|uniref:Suppressor of fused-like domain-containing protein n=1 Tax=Hymenobacter amundsenii TaxID=2006685 RepID=A0A246FHZ1_9BACT|nr:suppressor of fused domain protein [Hymenobacter amundsenii]OWP62152.1 hypothetical protein CDA63_15575 [Hymenobacter amundsenii]